MSGAGRPAFTAEPFAEPLAARLDRAGPDEGVRFHWLGQAGFAVAGAGSRLLIDPYLSDSLAEKYRGKTFSHERMMPAPVAPEEMRGIDLVLASHHHTDHMDAATLAPIAAANPACRFVVPRASLDEAARRAGVGPERLIGLDAGETVSPVEGVSVTAVRAAHETLERTAEGWHRFLGFVIAIGGMRLYHSGDTVPFEGLAQEVAALEPAVALLPVNGRSAALTKAGIVGNLDLAEARGLAAAIGVEDMIAHHYGMFAFNTVPADTIDRAAEDGCMPRVHRARTGIEYRLC